MKLTLLFLLLTGSVVQVKGQLSDTIKITLVAGRDIVAGATLTVKDTKPTVGTITDLNGQATIAVPTNKSLIEISLIGPYILLTIERPTDSIYFDLNSKKAIFYYNKKKIKTRKQIIRGY